MYVQYPSYCTLLNFWTAKLTLRVSHLYSERLYVKTVLPIFPTCCTGGSNPLISLSPQERTTSANNQPWTPNRLRGSHRWKQHTERYTVFQLHPLHLCHEYFIRQQSQRCCCLPGWKRGEETRVVRGWGGGVRQLCRGKRRRPRSRRASHREYALSHLVPQRDPSVYCCRPALRSFLEVV